MKKQILATVLVLGLTTTAFSKTLECLVTKPDGSETTFSDEMKDSPRGAIARLDFGMIDKRTYDVTAMSGSASDDQKESVIVISAINFSNVRAPEAAGVSARDSADFSSSYTVGTNMNVQVRINCKIKPSQAQ